MTLRSGLYTSDERANVLHRKNIFKFELLKEAFQTKSTRSIRSVTRSDHGHRVDPREVDKLAQDLQRLAKSRQQPQGFQQTKHYGVF